jgi:hypothetical protein
MSSRTKEYLIPGRLEDVVALIQVLGLDPEHARRSDKALEEELQAKPASAQRWSDVAKQHTEFFRVNVQHEYPVSLIARDVGKRTGDRRPPLSVEFVQELVKTAVGIHDIQVKRSQTWTLYIPVGAAVLAGVVAIVAAIINVMSGHK